MNLIRLSGILPLLLTTIFAPGLRAADETAAGAQPALTPVPADEYEAAIRPLLLKYCAACHDADNPDHPVRFLRAGNADDVADARGLWRSVSEQLRNRTMPPADAEQPSEEVRLQIVQWVDRTLTATACRDGEFAGPVTTRRLNRDEYDNVIRDLLGIARTESQRFPIDGSGGEGFDNNGETLFLPPILMERYLEAADHLLSEVVITPAIEINIPAGAFLRSDEAAKQAPLPNAEFVLSDADRTAAPARISVSGNYRVRVRLAQVPPSETDTTLELQVDGIRAAEFGLKSLSAQRDASADRSPSLHTDLRLTRGDHLLILALHGDTSVAVHSIELKELVPERSTEQIAAHRRLFGRDPGADPGDASENCREVLRRFVRRAFRRPVDDNDIAPFISLFDRATARGDSFEQAMKLALKAVMVSTEFLFRLEAAATSETPAPISDHELAVRLSSFLWSSMPDEKLDRLADDHALQNDEELSRQVDRMLDDPKAVEFCEHFIGQWLGTAEVAASVVPDTGRFKGEFTTELLMDFRDEPVQMFEYLIRDDRSLLELVFADYVVVNDRLLGHYALSADSDAAVSRDGSGQRKNPWSANPRRGTGGRFRRQDVADGRRGGVLGMGAVHLLTSYPERTSPVLRGAWVLETLLGIRGPNPPDDVPDLRQAGKKGLSVREQLAAHRESAACAACHNLMDPVGFALDNYDVLGRWREKDGRSHIDASALLPSGESFTGLPGLKSVLTQRKEEFIRHLTRKMLGYALGRSLTDYDDCTIDRIARAVKDSDYRTRTLIREIVLSTPFRYRQSGRP